MTSGEKTIRQRWGETSVRLMWLTTFAVVGIVVACIGYCDPDTCWHLAFGKWVHEHHSLPSIDPFSSNINAAVFIAPGRPLIHHEWLSDVLFYAAYVVGGAVGPLLLTAVCASLALIVVPGRMLQRAGAPRAVSAVLLLSLVCACSFRLWVRPEAFSFVCFSALIIVNELIQNGSTRRAIACCLAAFGIMVLWANLHGIFVLGIAYLGVYFISLLVAAAANAIPSVTSPAVSEADRTASVTPPAASEANEVEESRREAALNETAGPSANHRSRLLRIAAILVVTLPATFCTPWGTALWHHVFDMFTSPISHSNKENGPFLRSDVFHPTFLPLVCFLFVSICSQCKNSKRPGQSRVHSMLAALLTIAGVFTIFAFRRMGPFGMLTVTCAVFISYAGARIEREGNNSIDNSRGSLVRVPRWAADSISGLALSAVLCFATASWVVPPKIPAPSRLFDPPAQAIAFLEKSKPTGRLLNDSKFGSMMTWDMPNPPDIFIDGRFDSFTSEVIRDYDTMRLCRPGWHELLDKYKIAWVFFRPNAPICQNLEHDPAWHSIYKNSAAEILQRNLTVRP